MNSPLAALLWVLSLAPIGILLLHVVVHRVLALGGRQVTGHASGVRAIALGLLVVLIAAVGLDILSARRGIVDGAAAALFVAIAYGAMALLYVNAINIAETSLTMHTLLEISWAGELSADVLYGKYNAAHMVRVRMERLVSLGQIRSEPPRYFLAGRWLLRFAQAVDLWRKAIGVPSPAILSQRAPQ